MRYDPTSHFPAAQFARFMTGATRVCLAGLLSLLACAVLTGCANRYKITLNNGNMITTRSKPKYDAEQGVYRFKDMHGNPAYVPAFRVKEYEPL